MKHYLNMAATYTTADHIHVCFCCLDLVIRLAIQTSRVSLATSQTGFPLLGPITPGECWDDTGGWTPAHVLCKSEFLLANSALVRENTHTRKPDKHWEEMLDTLISERGQGKIVGPFAAPPSWNVRTVPVDASRMTPEDYRPPLLDPPADLMAASCAFAIMSESVTGATAWQRLAAFSAQCHNSNERWSSPPHMDDVIATARQMHAQGMGELHCVSHDHDSADRQLLLARAVWVYGRFSDLLMHSVRTIFIMVVGHYVDDFTGIENARTAMTAFESFQEFNEILGATMKACRETCRSDLTQKKIESRNTLRQRRRFFRTSTSSTKRRNFIQVL